MIQFTSNLKRNLSVLLLTVSTGCAHNSPAPVVDLAGNQSAKHSYLSQSNVGLMSERSEFPLGPKSYKVKPGDTLFSIAWYYSLDHNELARINRLRSNVIYPGQVISLRAFAPIMSETYFNPDSLLAALNAEVLRKPVTLNRKKVSERKLASTGKVNRRISQSLVKKEPARYKNAKKANIERPKKVATLTKPRKINRQTSSRPKVKQVSYQRTKNRKLNWIWPTDGKVVGRFSDKSNANRGLDIAASQGQAVRASAPGRVVYEGNGLRGYGNLVIIKHNNNYLSAYAHNQKIHVSENEFVKAGQRIADIGSSGTQTNKLHFEIRYNGKPVDPLNYLPRK